MVQSVMIEKSTLQLSQHLGK